MGNTLLLRIFALSFLALIVARQPVMAQNVAQGDTCREMDISDIIRKWRKQELVVTTPKKNSLILIPSVSSNPATSLAFGIAGQYAFVGKEPESLYSAINGSMTYTLKNQFLFQVKNNIYLKNNRLFLSGDWRIYLFSQPTYGLGTTAPEGGALDYQFNLNSTEFTFDSLTQPMEFNHYRFHQTISWSVREYFYLGFGYHLDLMDNIHDIKLDTISANPLYTSHYLYSEFYDFNTENYLISGLSFNVTYDSRDNMVNPYKGIYANLNYRINPEFLGSRHTANLTTLEFRSYHNLSENTPRHLLAFWVMGSFSDKGKIPYLILPALAYDQRGRAGRGYTQGRYRGNNLVYTEAEYRFPISQCTSVLGGVVFANITTASNPFSEEKLFEAVAPGYGFGLRVKVDKQSRTNLQVDFGFGKQSGGIYFGASETF